MAPDQDSQNGDIGNRGNSESGGPGEAEHGVGHQEGSESREAAERGAGRRRSRWWYLILLIPYVGLLYVPFYNGLEPWVAGFPYFLWYQFLFVFVGVVCTALVYWIYE